MTSVKRIASACLFAALICISILAPPVPSLAQETPRYDFVGFEVGYDRLLNDARKQEYAIKEEEIKAPYGVYNVLLSK